MPYFFYTALGFKSIYFHVLSFNESHTNFALERGMGSRVLMFVCILINIEFGVTVQLDILLQGRCTRSSIQPSESSDSYKR